MNLQCNPILKMDSVSSRKSGCFSSLEEGYLLFLLPEILFFLLRYIYIYIMLNEQKVEWYENLAGLLDNISYLCHCSVISH